MSEFYVKVVSVENVEKHPNADKLDICTVLNDYPVITKRDQYKIGDNVVYVSVDALVPVKDSRWSFLTDDVTKEYQRIKAKKLRGIFSMGILTPADSSWTLGQDVQDLLDIKKYEPEAEKENTGGLSVHGPNIPVYDLEGLRKYKWVLENSDEVVLTEKLHGANSRYLYDKDGVFWAGSHRQFKKEDPNNMWWKIVEKYSLKEKLQKYPNYAFYGEVYGNVQKDFPYDNLRGEVSFRLFDVWNVYANAWLSYDEILMIAKELNLDMVPELYRGLWSEDLLNHAEGNSTLASHIREGFVLQVIKEKFNEKVGRSKFKFVGQGYHLRKE